MDDELLSMTNFSFFPQTKQNERITRPKKVVKIGN
jgi:hypothetical protein